MTQNQVAIASGISRNLYNMFERGKRIPRPDIAQKIAVTLNFDWTIFFTAKSNKTTHASQF